MKCLLKFLISVLIIITINLIVWVTILSANGTNTWSGAGPNACLEQCSQEWAESKLTPEELQELNELRNVNPKPDLIEIRNGDVFTWMSYQLNGKPIGYRTETVATLNQTEEAYGWHLDGWSFIKITSCANWAVIRHQGIYSYITPVPERKIHYSYVPEKDPFDGITVLPPVPLPSGLVLIFTFISILTFVSYRIK